MVDTSNEIVLDETERERTQKYVQFKIDHKRAMDIRDLEKELLKINVRVSKLKTSPRQKTLDRIKVIQDKLITLKSK